MKKQTEQQVYVVRMYRRDQEVIDIFRSTNFKECKAEWTKLHTQWQECHKEGQVFVLEKPLVTAFEPGLISEIVVLPDSDPVNNIDDDNPYKQQMQKQGLNHTMRGAGGLPDLLDGGFSS